MSRQAMTRPILILGLMASIAEAQSPAKSEGRRYKVAFWYDLDRPFSSVKYRAYDLAKGEYDQAAVDRWRRTILENHPRHGATVRDLTTVGEPGATEAERLANAVGREKQRWAERNSDRSRPIPGLAGPTPTTFKARDREVGRAGFDRPAPGSPGPVTNPPTSPFPYPYRSGPR